MTNDSDQTRLAELQHCPSCGLANAVTNRFCTSCGSALIGARPDPASASGVGSPSAPAASTQPIPAPGMTSRFSSSPSEETVSITHVLSSHERTTHPFEEQFTIGRETGDLTVPDDRFLSARHLEVRKVGSRYVLSDLESSNGTFMRLRAEVELRPGDEVLIGGQVFRFLV